MYTTDDRGIVSCVGWICAQHQERGEGWNAAYLADAGVANEEKLEEVVVLGSMHGARRIVLMRVRTEGLAGGRGGRRMRSAAGLWRWL